MSHNLNVILTEQNVLIPAFKKPVFILSNVNQHRNFTPIFMTLSMKLQILLNECFQLNIF